MSGIHGYITTENFEFFAWVIRRSEELDALLASHGYDANEINVIHNPLVGASEHASIKVLISPRDPISDAALALNQTPDFLGKWYLILHEFNSQASDVIVAPVVGATLSQPDITIINNPGIPMPIRDASRGSASIASAPSNKQATTDIPITATEGDYAPSSVALGSATTPPQRLAKMLETQDLSQVAASTAQSVTPSQGGLQAMLGEPRAMFFSKLIPTSIRQLRAGAGISRTVDLRGRPVMGENAVYVMEFTDTRWMLNSVRSTSFDSNLVHDGIISTGQIKDFAGLPYTGGMARACFNMLADPPVAFEANTVAKTVTYPPALLYFPGFAHEAYRTESDPINAPTWHAHLEAPGDLKYTNTAASPTHIQQPYSRDDLFKALAQQVSVCTNGALSLDISMFEEEVALNGEAAFDDGDIINLDFRGMTVGESLDAFAQRLGCVWLFDAAAPVLRLSMARGLREQTSMTVPDSLGWLKLMEPYRGAGYINSLTLDLPQTVVVTHEAYYCSRLGPERSGTYGFNWFGVYGYDTTDVAHTFAHLVDSRSHESNDGVISTRFLNGLNARTPKLWHTLSPTITHITVELQDHIPAMIGHNTSNGFVPIFLPGTNSSSVTAGSFVNGPEFWFSVGKPYGLGNTNTRLDTFLAPDGDSVDYEVPWNYSSGLLRTAVRELDTDALETTPTEPGAVLPVDTLPPFDTTLKRRREVLQTRMNELRSVIDGDAVYSRMPPLKQYGFNRWQITPSVGLQYESIRFGAPGIATVEYRIYGKNTHRLLYPAGAKVEPVTSGAGIGASMVSGIKHFNIRRTLRTNIVRTFMARIIGVQRIYTEDPTTTDDQKAYFHKYMFIEAAPDANPFTMYWSSGSALGYKGLCSGVAFNLYEQWFNLEPNGSNTLAYPHSVGGMPLNFDFGPNDSTAIRKPYEPKIEITPVYEVTNRMGFTSYWLAVQPDIEVICPPNASNFFASPPAPWPYMGASGAARPTESDIASIIETA